MHFGHNHGSGLGNTNIHTSPWTAPTETHEVRESVSEAVSVRIRVSVPACSCARLSLCGNLYGGSECALWNMSLCLRLCACLPERASLRHVCTRAWVCVCACLCGCGTCVSLCPEGSSVYPRGVVSPSTCACASVRVPVDLCVYLVLVAGSGCVGTSGRPVPGVSVCLCLVCASPIPLRGPLLCSLMQAPQPGSRGFPLLCLTNKGAPPTPLPTLQLLPAQVSPPLGFPMGIHPTSPGS